MRSVILFLAMSLDGYLADDEGGVDWLEGQAEGGADPDTYSDFIQSVDTVLMGWNTYHQVTTELSPQEWVYPEQTSYVFTHRNLPAKENIRFTAEDPCALVRELRWQSGKKIWVCGGAQLIRQLVEQDLIDEYYVSVIPVILGSGIRLFGTDLPRIPLKLQQTKTYNGITDLHYVRRG